MSEAQSAQEVLAKLRAGFAEQDRLREEYEAARRVRVAIQREIARRRRFVIFSLEFVIEFKQKGDEMP